MKESNDFNNFSNESLLRRYIEKNQPEEVIHYIQQKNLTGKNILEIKNQEEKTCT